MVGSTPPEMTRAVRRRARPGRGAWRRWRAVLCVALLAPLLPAAAGPAAAQSDPLPADVSGSKFADTAEIDSPGCYFGRIDKPVDMHTDESTRTKKIYQSDPTEVIDEENGIYGVTLTTVPIADVDRVKVSLEQDKVYVFEVRGKDTGVLPDPVDPELKDLVDPELPDPELRGVYVNPDDDDGPYGDELRKAIRMWGFWAVLYDDDDDDDNDNDNDDHIRAFHTLYRGRIYSNGISGNEYDDLRPENNPDRVVVVDTYDDDEMEQPGTELPRPDLNDSDRGRGDLAYDLDDGIGQDAWMLFKPFVDGEYFLQIEGSGGFFGSYTVLVYEAGTEIMYEIGADGSCEVINESLTIEAVEKSVYEGTDAKFLIRGPDEMAGQVVNLYYEYVGYDDYFESSSPSAGLHPVQLTTELQQSNGVWEVKVATVSDTEIEGKLGSVTIAIKPKDTVYTVGDPASATVVVVDDDNAPIIKTEAKQHDDLPLWKAVVSWELREDVDDQVTLWDVDWWRGSCDLTPREDSPYWIGPGYTAPNPHDTSFEWFASDDSIHFRVRALFKGGVYGPWSKTKCQEAPEEVAQPQVTVSLKFLTGSHGDEDYELKFHAGKGRLFPLEIEFRPAVDISRAELYGALHVEEGKLKRSDVIWVGPDEPGDPGVWAILVRPRTNTSIMKITLYCDPPPPDDPDLDDVEELQQCTGVDPWKKVHPDPDRS